VTLPFPDINIMLTNLEQQGFTGYVKLELYKLDGILFFSHGAMVRSVEVDEAGVHPYPQSRVLNRVKRKEVPVSTYILSSQVVGVLSSLFAFQPLYLDYQVGKKELKKVLNNLEAENYTGILEVVCREGTVYILIDRGKLITDNFTKEYGQILCGSEAMSSFLDAVYKSGAVINVYAEKAQDIDSKRRALEEEMEKIKQLIVKVETGLFKGADIAKVDEYITREWGIKPGVTFSVEVEAPDGTLYEVKCTSAKKVGGYINLPGSSMKKIKLKSGDLVSIRPLR